MSKQPVASPPKAATSQSLAAKRAEVYAKYEGRCAYCGQGLPPKGFHVDHRDPCFRGWETMPRPEDRAHARDPKSYTLEELEPACGRCNRWKSVRSMEQFRIEIAMQIERVRRDSAGFRLAEDFGLVQTHLTPVLFYFERIKLAQEGTHGQTRS